MQNYEWLEAFTIVPVCVIHYKDMQKRKSSRTFDPLHVFLTLGTDRLDVVDNTMQHDVF